MNEPVAISILVALTIGWIVFLLLRGLAETWLKRGASMERPKTVVERADPYLQLIPLPAPIRKAWATEGLAQRLRHAGIQWSPELYARLHWALIWILSTFAVWFIFSRDIDLLSVFIGGLMLLAALLGPGILLRLQVDRRQMEVDLALPDFLDRLALGMEAGLGFEIAFRRTSENFHGLLGGELRRAVRQIDRGHPVSGALEELISRNPSNDLRALAASVTQSEKLGTSLAKALRLQTVLLRARRRRRAQEASRRLPILIVFPLVFCFLPALMIIYLAPPILHLVLGQ